jgi:aryl-alcohol dehydrogenase-like predicted oxidoreductase
MTVERYTLAPGFDISRMIRGGWQLSGGHGDVDRARAIDDMSAFIDQGVTNFDCADIYSGVEDMYGAFRERLIKTRGAEAARAFKVHTKFVPDWEDLGRIDRRYVTNIIDRSLQRLQVEQLDLVQFHWWNYDAPGLVDTALLLQDLQRSGKIAHLAGTNFDTPRSKALLDAGVPLVSMQVQYSLLDVRAENGLVALGRDRNMAILCYGTLAGGFLSETWLGKPEPSDGLVNRSLIKYKLVIDDFGGWDLFQDLLETLDDIATKHDVTIPAVATRWMLDQPGVAAVIVGARYAHHLDGALGMFKLRLDDWDRGALAAVLRHRKGPVGDTFDLERDREGRHGRIMKYNLNKA